MAKLPPKVLLVCSSGGHLLQMKQLADTAFFDVRRQWACLPTSDAKSLLSNENVIWAQKTTKQSPFTNIRIFFVALKTLLRHRPDYIMSTGADIAIPFLFLGRLLFIKTIFVESFARQTELSPTGKSAYSLADLFVVQNAELARKYPKAVYAGEIY